MIKRLLFWWWNRKMRSEVVEDLRRRADAPGLAFRVGDRIKARNHERVDDAGGIGVVRELNYWHPELQRITLRVEFDSMPGKLFSMSSSELCFER